MKKSRKTQKAPTNLLNTRIDEEEELHNNTGRASVLAVAKFKKRMKQRKKGKEAQVVASGVFNGHFNGLRRLYRFSFGTS